MNRTLNFITINLKMQ